jgi:heme exporter protein C
MSTTLEARNVDATAVTRPRWLLPFGAFSILFFIAAQAISLYLSQPDRDMGHLQKIMYVHVPSAWVSMIAFFVVFVTSLLYLIKRDIRHDLMAASAAEVGVILTALTLALGSIWGRPTWGVYWTWDPRLTTTAILLLIYVGYLALRAFTEDEDRRARWAATVGIFGFMNVPIVYMSVRWWRTIHQVQSTPSTVDPYYVIGLRLNAFAFLFLFIFFVGMRYYIARLERTKAVRLEERALAEE